jgi:hypothetical protein
MHTHLRTFALGVMVILATRSVLAQSCPGDLDGDNQVTINEIITAINAALDGCSDASRFIDNGNGTVTDMQTHLVWEKKSDDGSIHDQNNTYTWSITGTEPDGLAFTVFLATLNGQAFAAHTDWRLPSVEELETLLDRGREDPMVDPIFNTNCATQIVVTYGNPGCTVTTCSCSVHGGGEGTYWSSTTGLNGPTYARAVIFKDGSTGDDPKVSGRPDGGNYVRAVRGGL